MKLIKNESLQGIHVCLLTPGGSRFSWLKPQERVVVPNNAVSKQAQTLHRRKRLKITNY